MHFHDAAIEIGEGSEPPAREKPMHRGPGDPQVANGFSVFGWTTVLVDGLNLTVVTANPPPRGKNERRAFRSCR
jgi:hypothetical protein